MLVSAICPDPGPSPDKPRRRAPSPAKPDHATATSRSRSSLNGVALGVTAALGAAFYPAEVLSSTALRELADQRMYADKASQKRNTPAD